MSQEVSRGMKREMSICLKLKGWRHDAEIDVSLWRQWVLALPARQHMGLCSGVLLGAALAAGKPSVCQQMSRVTSLFARPPPVMSREIDVSCRSWGRFWPSSKCCGKFTSRTLGF